jgi:hypothetical protein
MPDTPITWKTYRDPTAAPVPVLEANISRSYRLEHRAQPEDEKLRVQPFEEAIGAYTGEEWSSRDWLPAKVLQREPVRILPQKRENLTTEWRWARPQFPRRDLYTHYDVPSLLPGEEAVLVPEYRRPASVERPTYQRARRRGNGVFEISPGYRKLQGVLVNGDPHAFTGYDYDPRHGALYLEQSRGEPMPADVNVEVFVDRSGSMRLSLRNEEPGEIPITAGQPERTVALVHSRREREMEDARRLPSPQPSDRWHAVGWAQYDGRPIPEGMMWTVETGAPPEEVEEATDLVMPAGTLYRVVSS